MIWRMKIERVDEKTVKCFLSNEELEQYDISYKDFVTRSDKAREVVEEIMAHAVEAASRSLPDHSPEAITALVNKIVDQQIAEGLHNESPLSFRDVNVIKNVFSSRLRTMYHSRISYPEAIRPQQPKS